MFVGRTSTSWKQKKKKKKKKKKNEEEEKESPKQSLQKSFFVKGTVVSRTRREAAPLSVHLTSHEESNLDEEFIS